MIVIREAQMRAFRQAMEEGFVRRAMAHLRKRYPGRTARLKDEGLRSVVEEALADARGLRFDTEKHAIVFIELSLVYGNDWHTRGKAAEILPTQDTCVVRLEALHAAGYRH